MNLSEYGEKLSVSTVAVSPFVSTASSSATPLSLTWNTSALRPSSAISSVSKETLTSPFGSISFPSFCTEMSKRYSFAISASSSSILSIAVSAFFSSLAVRSLTSISAPSGKTPLSAVTLMLTPLNFSSSENATSSSASSLACSTGAASSFAASSAGAASSLGVSACSSSSASAVSSACSVPAASSVIVWLSASLSAYAYRASVPLNRLRAIIITDKRSAVILSLLLVINFLLFILHLATTSSSIHDSTPLKYAYMVIQRLDIQGFRDYVSV